jgi:hypothetical protein
MFWELIRKHIARAEKNKRREGRMVIVRERPLYILIDYRAYPDAF